MAKRGQALRTARAVKKPAKPAVGQEQEIAALKRELAQEREQRAATIDALTATAEMLKIISRSTFDLGSVLATVAETAARLCQAEMAFVSQRDGDVFRYITSVGSTPEAMAGAIRFQKDFLDTHPISGLSGRRTITGRVISEGGAVQIADITADAEYQFPETFKLAKIRTLLGVPLIRDGEPIGVMNLARQRVEPFTERQIELVRSFADQVVIAIENTRLMTEQREALEQQTATVEVLQVINASPGNLVPVFTAMLEKATRLCGAGFGALWLYDGERFSVAATHALPAALAEFVREPMPVAASASMADIVRGQSLVHVPDLAATELYHAGNHARRAYVDLGGARTLISVALRKDNALLGAINVYRQEVRPFTDKEIALLQNFAAQAVIAMENVRLITETREALAQQTATAEVLGVINASPGDLAPVFDAILEKAHSLCGVAFGSLQLYDGEKFRAVAVHGLSEEVADRLRQGYIPGRHHRPILEGGRFTQIPDLSQIDDPVSRAAFELGGIRTVLFIPLRKDGTLLGQISASRREVRPFAEKEIALMENFAAQAVIAMENARLMTETREALEQQTATAEVLQVINSSPGNLTPVFDKMLEEAMRLCEAAFGGLWIFEGDRYVARALRGVPAAYAEFLSETTVIPGPGTAPYRYLHGERSAIQNIDLAAEEPYRAADPQRCALVDLGGARTALQVPLCKDDAVLGVVTIYRQQVRAFSDRQIKLLENFAAQAVIAMENARLLTETREALEQQTATAEILRVINASPGDLVPVFDAILDKAHGLCGVAYGSLQLYDGAKFRAVATHGLSEAFANLLREGYSPGPNHPTQPLLAGARFAHFADLVEIDDPLARAAAELSGVRTALFIPLRKDDTLLGMISSARKEVKPFSEKEIALLESFAAQAVIAMENARLLGELRQRTADLARSVDELTATGDVLKIISRSSVDLGTVLDTLVETVARLCRADEAHMFRRRDELFHMVAAHGLSEEAKTFFITHPFAADRGTATGRVALERRAVHIRDVLEDPEYTYKEAQKIIGYRTMLGIPLLREEMLVGVFTLHRTRVEPFSDNEIELATSFADQAVIAIENARLFDELRERQAELRVTFDNMGDGVAMFDGQQRLAAWNRNFQQIVDLPDAFLAGHPTYADYIRILSERGEFGTDGIDAELSRLLQDTDLEVRRERTRPDGRVIEVRRNAVPGGGFVLIYSDITERKRAEEAIRAARDAAETALRELQTAQASLVHAQKMAALGQLTAGIAHEIKNPLNFVNNFAGLSVELLDELKEATTRAIGSSDANARAEIVETIEMLTGNLAKIAEHGRRADGIVRSMLQHSRGGSGERQSTDLNALLEEALNLAYHGARAQDQSFNITMERDLDRNLAAIEIVPQDVMRVFLNLIGNGFYAANKRSREGESAFRPLLTVTTREIGEAVEIRVRDNGVGIAAEHREKLFQPFFTTKPTGEGTGLGLSISYEIVTQQHGGTITVDSEVGHFTEFTVRLPRRRH